MHFPVRNPQPINRGLHGFAVWERKACPASAASFPAAVLMKRGDGVVPTRPRSRRSASQQAPTVGSSEWSLSVCQVQA